MAGADRADVDAFHLISFHSEIRRSTLALSGGRLKKQEGGAIGWGSPLYGRIADQ